MKHRKDYSQVRAKQTIKSCIKRGKERGICHVFVDNSKVCLCGEKDLNKYRRAMNATKGA